MGEIPLKIEGLSTSFHHVDVLKSLDLTVNAGSIVGIVGRNGVGKSTLIKSITGLLQPKEGSIEIFGMDFRDHHSRANVAYLPELFRAPQQMPISVFLRMSLRFFNKVLDKTELLEHAEVLDLDKALLNKPMKVLSKGNSQKVGLILMLMCDAPLLILDEPSSGLDPLARRGLRTSLTSLRERGTAIIITSHELFELERFADVNWLLHEGKLSGPWTKGYLKQSGQSLDDVLVNVSQPPIPFDAGRTPLPA